EDPAVDLLKNYMQ
nr:Chain A, Gag polyprotein [Simian immunodeficiency virus - mac K6W]